MSSVNLCSIRDIFYANIKMFTCMIDVSNERRIKIGTENFYTGRYSTVSLAFARKNS
jgi:hypothetical protein